MSLKLKNKVKPYRCNDLVLFGKYYGKTIKYICNVDPLWIKEEMARNKDFKLTEYTEMQFEFKLAEAL